MAGKVQVIFQISLKVELVILTLALWLGCMKEYFEFHSHSFLVWRFANDPALPANRAYKKIDT